MSSTQLVKWLQSSHGTENPTRASGHIFLVFWVKLRMEEEWMRSQFGETYATYGRHPPPWCPTSSDRLHPETHCSRGTAISSGWITTQNLAGHLSANPTYQDLANSKGNLDSASIASARSTSNDE